MEIIDDSTGQCQTAHWSDEKDGTECDVEKDCSKTAICRRVNYESKVATKGDYGHADVYVSDFNSDHGTTPLHVACRAGHLEAVEFLLAKCGKRGIGWQQLVSDSERDCAKCHRKMALVLPTGRDHLYQDPDCTELKKRSKTSLFSPGGLKVAKLPGHESSCHNCHDKEGCTPLHIAAYNGHAEIVKLLLRVDCHPGIENNQGKTPLHLACEQGHLDVVRYLVTENLKDGDKKLNVRDRDGRTALHYTCLNGYLQIVKLLVESHCDSNATDNELRTPLHFSCIGGHLDVMVYLIEHDCKPTVPDRHGFVSLHIASMYGHFDIVVYLVDHKLCDPERKTKFGKTARTIAQGKGHKLIVDYFDKVATTPSIGTTITTVAYYNSSDDNPASLSQGPKTGFPDRPRRLRDFTRLKERLKTFHQPPFPWPRNRPSGKELAEVGFFYRGFEEYVKCFSCGVEICRWENESNPLLLHYIKRRSCEFLQTHFKSEIDRFSSDPSAQHYSEKYANSSARLHSFTTWPLGHIVTSYQLASVGFFYTQEGTKVQCFSCGLTYKDWKNGTIPLLVHRKNSPLCQFLNTLINKPTPAPVPIPTPPATPTKSSHPSSKHPSTPTPSTLSPMSQKDLSRPDWVNEQVRLKSFKYLPPNVPISKEECAKAGLYFVKKPDTMKCFSCNKTVRDWIDGDVPVEKHREVSPQCKFLKEFFPTKLDKKLSESSDEGFDPSGLPEPDFSEADLEKLAQKKLTAAEHYTYGAVQSPVMGEQRQSDINPGFSRLSVDDPQFRTQPSYASELPPWQRQMPPSFHHPQIGYHMQQPGVTRSSALVTGSSVMMNSFASAGSNRTASSAHSIRQSLGSSVSGSAASSNSFSSEYARKEFAPPTGRYYPTPREEYVSPELRPYQQQHTTTVQVLPQAFGTVASTKGSADRPIALPPSYYPGGPVRPPLSLPTMQHQTYGLKTTSVTNTPQYHTVSDICCWL